MNFPVGTRVIIGGLYANGTRGVVISQEEFARARWGDYPITNIVYVYLPKSQAYRCVPSHSVKIDKAGEMERLRERMEEIINAG